MRFAHAASVRSGAPEIASELVSSIQQQLGLDASVDLAVFMCTSDIQSDVEPVLHEVHEKLRPSCLVGCMGEGVFGGGREFERTAAVTLLAGHLPGVRLQPVAFAPADLAPDRVEAAVRGAEVAADSGSGTLILLADPFTAPAEPLLDAVDRLCPGWAVAGGMASGVSAPGESRLFLNERILDAGAVGVALSGNVRTRTLVSQGCRPVGKPFVITQAERNVILGLGGQRAMDRMREVYMGEAEPVRELMRYGLMVGRVINEQQEKFRRGDFLVRSVMGFDEGRGAIVAGDLFRAGQTIQFHVRDAETASEDLRELLETIGKEPSAPAGGLCFSCNGRGTRMFDEPGHESEIIFETLGRIPLVGHFAAGEFGGVGGRTFIHGHTLSLALFSERSE
jgi:small ligand-binding sensory domain FIST